MGIFARHDEDDDSSEFLTPSACLPGAHALIPVSRFLAARRKNVDACLRGAHAQSDMIAPA